MRTEDAYNRIVAVLLALKAEGASDDTLKQALRWAKREAGLAAPLPKGGEL